MFDSYNGCSIVLVVVNAAQVCDVEIGTGKVPNVISHQRSNRFVIGVNSTLFLKAMHV